LNDEKKEWNSYGIDCGLCRLRNIGSKLLTISADIKQTNGGNSNGYSERSLHG
jgi:hypothetical protein